MPICKSTVGTRILLVTPKKKRRNERTNECDLPYNMRCDET